MEKTKDYYWRCQDSFESHLPTITNNQNLNLMQQTSPELWDVVQKLKVFKLRVHGDI